MLTVLILVGGYLAVATLYYWIKDTATESRECWEYRVHAAGEREDLARLHEYDLLLIEQLRQRTAAELDQAARSGDRDVLERPG